ncbi:serine O-acetyltransferase [Streptomyces sp. SceaMP-e96]|nr:serine acetyltransferase [Streptomyces sp. SID4951]SCK59436.1 serine O-acetyltransferase [Streptomyces sp. SceaMP-e96]
MLQSKPDRKPRSAAVPFGSRRAGDGPLSRMLEDIDTTLARDPSIASRAEAVFHSTLPALWIHRVAHHLYGRRHRITARVLTSCARVLTGIEIHPGARIGRRLFIDHGTGVVIGETAVLGDDVTIYQQVTLGAVGWWRDKLRPSGDRRHPQVGDRVTLGVNATVLGPLAIGDDALIGAHALVLDSVAPGRRIMGEPTVARPGKTTDISRADSA